MTHILEGIFFWGLIAAVAYAIYSVLKEERRELKSEARSEGFEQGWEAREEWDI